jgi:hypothetical protein
MTDFLTADALMQHVRVLADGIGPRPAGHLEEAAARHYIRGILETTGITTFEEIPFSTPDTWGYASVLPTALVLLSNGLGILGRIGKVAGGVAALAGAYEYSRMMTAQKPSIELPIPTRHSTTLIARIPPTGDVWRRLVLLGHTDTNKHRPTHAPGIKYGMLAASTAGLLLMAANGLSQIAAAFGVRPGSLQRWSWLGLACGLAILLNDETGGYVQGGNDNASAVACLLGLGARLHVEPLQHTEVWLAFTGAEEVGCLGLHALIDRHGDRLRDAWFLDFEMVGAREIVYVTRHSSFSYLTPYTPDPESLAWAADTARANPDLGVQGRPMAMTEEVGSLRGRGYRGICLAGVGPDGWLHNWHQYSDIADNVEPAGLERAARFAWAMIKRLDTQA